MFLRTRLHARHKSIMKRIWKLIFNRARITTFKKDQQLLNFWNKIVNSFITLISLFHLKLEHLLSLENVDLIKYKMASWMKINPIYLSNLRNSTMKNMFPNKISQLKKNLSNYIKKTKSYKIIRKQLKEINYNYRKYNIS